MHIKYPHYLRRNTQMLGLGLLCLTASFAIGIQSAGDIQPVALIEAGSIELAGDVDGNGILDTKDALRILEVSQGYSEPTIAEHKADPTEDGVLTVEDAMLVLARL